MKNAILFICELVCAAFFVAMPYLAIWAYYILTGEYLEF